MATEEIAYQPKDAISEAIRGTLIVGGAGLALSAIQNTLTKQNVTAWGVFTRTGGTIVLFGTVSLIHIVSLAVELTETSAAVGGVFSFANLASANLREKDDSWNPAIGGFLAGGVAGLRCWPVYSRDGFQRLT